MDKPIRQERIRVMLKSIDELLHDDPRLIPRIVKSVKKMLGIMWRERYEPMENTAQLIEGIDAMLDRLPDEVRNEP